MTPEIIAPEITAMKDAARLQRMETWRLTIEQELQSLINQAADMRKTINEATTSVKKKYYTKKFKKLSEQVIQLLAIQSQLPPREQPDSVSTDTTTSVESV
jgi:hypothetical protein